MRRFWFLIALLAIVVCAPAQKAEAQYYMPYGYGNPYGAAMVPSPYYGPPPIYGYGGVGIARPMPLGRALATAAIITAINNRGYGRYGYQPYTGYGFRGGYGGISRHQMHEMREHGGYGGYGYHRH